MKFKEGVLFIIFEIFLIVLRVFISVIVICMVDVLICRGVGLFFKVSIFERR